MTFTQPAPDPMGPCTGPLGCTLGHGDHPVAASWCVALGDVAPFPACDYHADLLERTLDGLVPINCTAIEVPDQVLDLGAARSMLHAADHEHALRERRADDWAPGEYTEAYGR